MSKFIKMQGMKIVSVFFYGTLCVTETRKLCPCTECGWYFPFFMGNQMESQKAQSLHQLNLNSVRFIDCIHSTNCSDSWLFHTVCMAAFDIIAEYSISFIIPTHFKYIRKEIQIFLFDIIVHQPPI